MQGASEGAAGGSHVRSPGFLYVPQAPGVAVPAPWLSSLMPALSLRQRSGALSGLVTGCAGSIDNLPQAPGVAVPAPWLSSLMPPLSLRQRSGDRGRASHRLRRLHRQPP
ncbi:hypothetical protein GALL_171730 [mine drainage metagenome]|uniref:Uncharacterized protein n=1 Tax=mine drainage metagenome TaxID=410659 RepID=A0A1J5RYQ5_9ZZZZ